MPNTIQSQDRRKPSRGGGKGGILYVTDSNGNLNVFNVELNDNGLWLNGNNGNPDNFWNGNNRWVFARRKSLHFSPLLHKTKKTDYESVFLASVLFDLCSRDIDQFFENLGFVLGEVGEDFAIELDVSLD